MKFKVKTLNKSNRKYIIILISAFPDIPTFSRPNVVYLAFQETFCYFHYFKDNIQNCKELIASIFKSRYICALKGYKTFCFYIPSNLSSTKKHLSASHNGLEFFLISNLDFSSFLYGLEKKIRERIFLKYFELRKIQKIQKFVDQIVNLRQVSLGLLQGKKYSFR